MNEKREKNSTDPGAPEAPRMTWERIFQAIGHATLILDPEHTIVMVNDAVVEATGMSRDELVGKKCYEVFHASDHPPESCPLESMKQSDRVETEAMEMEALGGTYLVSCTPVFDDEGHLDKFVHIATDITRRKEIEEKLCESEEKYRSLFYGTPLGTFRYDKRGVITDCNEKFVEIIGSSKAALVGLDMIHDLEDEDLIEEVKHSLADGEGYYEGKYTSVTADKTTPVRVLFKGMRNEEGNIYAGMGLVEDITERKRAEEKLEEREENLRTTLNSIGEAVISTDLDGNIVRMNPIAEELTGWSRDAALGKPIIV